MAVAVGTMATVGGGVGATGGVPVGSADLVAVALGVGPGGVGSLLSLGLGVSARAAGVERAVGAGVMVRLDSVVGTPAPSPHAVARRGKDRAKREASATLSPFTVRPRSYSHAP